MTVALPDVETMIDQPRASHHLAGRESSVRRRFPSAGRLGALGSGCQATGTLGARATIRVMEQRTFARNLGRDRASRRRLSDLAATRDRALQSREGISDWDDALRSVHHAIRETCDDLRQYEQGGDCGRPIGRAGPFPRARARPPGPTPAQDRRAAGRAAAKNLIISSAISNPS